MQISSLLIGLFLLVASLAFVSLPFRQTKKATLKPRKVDNRSNGRRESVLSALRDLDFDFKTGKISEEDYTPLRAQLLSEVAQYIDQEKSEEERLEALIQVRRTTQQQGAHCGQCGSPMETGQRFCSKCGTVVDKEICPSCGKKIRADDQFCSSCGGRLEVKLEAVGQS